VVRVATGGPFMNVAAMDPRAGKAICHWLVSGKTKRASYPIAWLRKMVRS
jgi:hypothetical protein